MGVKLEVCVDTVAGLHAAIAGGADRIELCAALDIGGLTPSPGLIAAASGAAIPVRAMIRPRAGDFCFDPAEFAQMKCEIDAVRDAGLDGVVLGIATPNGGLDVAAMAELRRYADTLHASLHRVIDTVTDMNDAVEAAVEVGFDTILTSGGAKRAAQGCDRLAEMVGAASGRLCIMPGSGVTRENCVQIVQATGADWVHSSCSAAVTMPDHLVDMGFCSAQMMQTSRAKTQELADMCHGFPA
ncbi:MAG: copper homeostasis protein CutC [Paracoccaceae bacterium]